MFTEKISNDFKRLPASLNSIWHIKKVSENFSVYFNEKYLKKLRK